jgi:hypothetical protein
MRRNSIAFASPPWCRVVTLSERCVTMKEVERRSGISFTKALHEVARESGGLTMWLNVCVARRSTIEL